MQSKTTPLPNSDQDKLAFVRELQGSNACVDFPVQGSSMLPLIPPEATVSVYLTTTEQLNIGDIMAFLDAQGALVVHRLIAIRKTASGRVFIEKGDNLGSSNPVPPERILGKVVAIKSNNGIVNLQTKKWQAFQFLVGRSMAILTSTRWILRKVAKRVIPKSMHNEAGQLATYITNIPARVLKESPRPASRPELQLLLALCRFDHDQQSRETASTLAASQLDWAYFKKACERLGVVPLVSHMVHEKEITLPEELKLEFSRQSQALAMRSLVQRAGILAVLDALAQKGVTPALMKGATLAHRLYPQPGLRPMGDLDLFCRKNDIAAVERAMAELGYEQNLTLYTSAIHERMEREFKHEPPFTKQSAITVEVHTNLYKNIPLSLGRMDRIWEHAGTQEHEGRVVAKLPENAELLSLLLHLYMNMHHGIIRLVWLFELDTYIRMYANTLNWNEIAQEADRIGMSREIQEVCTVLHRHWQTPIPSRMTDEHARDNFQVLLEDAVDGRNLQAKPIRSLQLKMKLLKRAGQGRDYSLALLRHVFPCTRYIRGTYGTTSTIQTAFFTLAHPFLLLLSIVRGVAIHRRSR